MAKAWVLLTCEWKLMLRHRVLVFVTLPVVGAFLLSKYGLLLVLPASALVLGIPYTGKMQSQSSISILPTAFTMFAAQTAIYVGISAAFHSMPGLWLICAALGVSLAIAVGRLHGR